LRYLLLSILALLLATQVNAADLLIIESHSNPLFDQTVRQIENRCGKSSRTLVMGDYAEFDLARIVREEQPRVVVAVGDRPLKESLKLRNTPVVYTMALTGEGNRQRENITGVSMHGSPDNYLKLLKGLGIRRTGVIYSKKISGAYIKRAQSQAAAFGVELVPLRVNAPNEVVSALSRLVARKIDSLWMLPDTTAVTAENVDAYFQLAQKNSIPLISFSRAYLDKGALAVLEASRTVMTEQLCAKITRILKGTAPDEEPVSDISAVSLYMNQFVANKLDLNISGVEKLFRHNSADMQFQQHSGFSPQ